MNAYEAAIELAGVTFTAGTFVVLVGVSVRLVWRRSPRLWRRLVADCGSSVAGTWRVIRRGAHFRLGLPWHQQQPGGSHEPCESHTGCESHEACESYMPRHRADGPPVTPFGWRA